MSAAPNLLDFVYRCRECGERLDPDEDLIFRDGNHFTCAKHREGQAINCMVKGCKEKPMRLGILCKEHQVLYGIGALSFNEAERPGGAK